ncbi:protoglobin domain-containing protein [Nannocystis sp. ILAH1]|uniref:protoglobin domain-containing protein n=1 Tax=unclassified Nannocystis TaxID=2627009 RepID=UPI00226FFAC6|nr:MULTISPECIES: protoglobin domain-containing protein [unclassified Nannocystis]MCY0991176.1 protoglobin domain-containing protein [Nannocystis sp. ILAH1]MCY1064690.1 protoglobin domain-containing protein [Nannocystis sp. RBIL2]
MTRDLPPAQALRARIDFDERELATRRAYFEIEDADLERLGRLEQFAHKHMDEVVEDFYRLLLGHAVPRGFFADEATIRRVKRLQRDYFLQLFAGCCDLEYVEDRLRVGAAHEAIGMQPRWYIGAYRHYLSILHDKLFADFADPAEASAIHASLLKLVMFDVSLAIDAYIAANLETIGRHQAALRELSTPIAKVHDGVLLLPLIGALDAQRAQQVMDAVLLRLVEERARVMILDIAGVAAVDGRVADHLVRTIAAMRLVGAQAILTGISPQVARTLTESGVDIGAVPTLAHLQEGIELALALVGKQIAERA